MSLQNRRELEVTREKLVGLESVYQTILTKPTDNEYTRELTLRSLRHTMNQLQEEIQRFEAHNSTVANS